MRRVLITGANRGLGLGLVQACLTGTRRSGVCGLPQTKGGREAPRPWPPPTRISLLPLLSLDVTDETAIARAAPAVPRIKRKVWIF